MKQLLPRIPTMPSPRNDIVATTLRSMASIASKETELDIFFPGQKDSSYMWGDTAIHPMQPLETAYRHIVNEAIRDIDEEEERRQGMLLQLSLFFQFTADEPKPMAEEIFTGVALTSTFDLLDRAEREVETAVKEQRWLRVPTDVSQTDLIHRLRTRLETAVNSAIPVLELFRNEEGHYPDLLQKARPLIQLESWVSKMITKEDFKTYVLLLQESIQTLRTAINGAASIQNFHVIDSFYLYRLMTKFQVQAKGEVSSDQRKKASGALTALMNNNQPAVIRFLKDCLLEINTQLKYIDANNIIFFLKGGRAMKYVLGKPDEGENDWDTSIVINPYLSPEKWYTLYAKVHNLLVYLLANYKIKFYLMLFKNYVSVNDQIHKAESNLPLPESDDESDEPWKELEESIGAFDMESCKAELIDIGIPRRDAIQAREHWTHLQGKILQSPEDNIPYPDIPYYLDEYLVMIRGEFNGDNHSIKTPKRVRRINEVLDSSGVDKTILSAESKITGLLTDSIKLAKENELPAIKKIIIYMLRQVDIAYDMNKDPFLASAFNVWFTKNPVLPPTTDLPASFVKATKKDDKFNDENMVLARAVGLGQKVSSMLLAQAKARADALEAQFSYFIDAIRTNLMNAIPHKGPAEGGMLVAIGAFAAQIQAKHLQFERMEEIVPCTTVQFSLMGFDKGNLQASLGVLAPLLNALDGNGANSIEVIYDKNKKIQKIQVIAKASQQFGELNYQPILFELDYFVLPEKRMLRTDFIDGISVLSLPDLIRQLQQDAANKVEYSFQRLLVGTCDALSEILTKFDVPVSEEIPSYFV